MLVDAMAPPVAPVDQLARWNADLDGEQTAAGPEAAAAAVDN
jgi:hypothetical protein